MSDKPTLATSVVDKNGKLTTVHRLAVEPSAGRKRIPAPGTPDLSAGRPAARLLPTAPPLTNTEADLFIRSSIFEWGPLVSDGINGITSRQSGLDMLALAKHLMDSGQLTEEETNYILDDEVTLLDSDLIYNTLLIFAYLKSSGRECPTADRITVSHGVNGLSANNSEKGNGALRKFTTEDELQRYGATVDFIVKTYGEQTIVDWVELYVGAEMIPHCLRITNKYLEKLVQTHPEDVERMSSYIKERGMSAYLMQPVTDLSQWLEDTRSNSAVDEGWL